MRARDLLNNAKLALTNGQAFIDTLKDKDQLYSHKNLLKRFQEYSWLLAHGSSEDLIALKSELSSPVTLSIKASENVANPWLAKTKELINQISYLKQTQNALETIKSTNLFAKAYSKALGRMIHDLERKNADILKLHHQLKELDNPGVISKADQSKGFFSKLLSNTTAYKKRFTKAKIKTLTAVMKDSISQVKSHYENYHAILKVVSDQYRLIENTKEQLLKPNVTDVERNQLVQVLNTNTQNLIQSKNELAKIANEINNKYLVFTDSSKQYLSAIEVKDSREKLILEHTLFGPINTLVATFNGNYKMGNSHREISFRDTLLQCLQSLGKDYSLGKINKICTTSNDYPDDEFLKKLAITLGVQIHINVWTVNSHGENGLQTITKVFNEHASEAIHMVLVNNRLNQLSKQYQFVPVLPRFPANDMTLRFISKTTQELSEAKFATRARNMKVLLEGGVVELTDELALLNNVLAWEKQGSEKWLKENMNPVGLRKPEPAIVEIKPELKPVVMESGLPAAAKMEAEIKPLNPDAEIKLDASFKKEPQPEKLPSMTTDLKDKPTTQVKSLWSTAARNKFKTVAGAAVTGAVLVSVLTHATPIIAAGLIAKAGIAAFGAFLGGVVTTGAIKQTENRQGLLSWFQNGANRPSHAALAEEERISIEKPSI